MEKAVGPPGKDRMKLVVVLLMVVAVLCLLVRRERNSGRKSRTTGGSRQDKRPDDRSGPYRAVSIDPRGEGCGMAVAQRDRRYLQGRVPALPLAGCDSDSCRCRYRHYLDRRDEDGDRRLVGGLESTLYPAGNERERRETLGRRRDDSETAIDLLEWDPDKKNGSQGSRAVESADVRNRTSGAYRQTAR